LSIEILNLLIYF